MDCCNQLYSKKFDEKRARDEIRDYRTGNIKKNSRPLLNILSNLNLHGLTLLDIGGGIGVLSFELLKQGVSHSTHIELSESYCKAFQDESVKRNVSQKVSSVQGDFTNLHDKVGPADLVCLDKVICCYSNFTDLVIRSSKNARRFYAYVIPRDVWWVKIVEKISGCLKTVIRDPFRTYIHPQKEIEELVLDNGFTKLFEVQNREWLTVVFERA